MTHVPAKAVPKVLAEPATKKYGQLGVTELRRMRMLEEENSRLKRVVADLTLDRHILQEVLRKKV